MILCVFSGEGEFLWIRVEKYKSLSIMLGIQIGEQGVGGRFVLSAMLLLVSFFVISLVSALIVIRQSNRK